MQTPPGRPDQLGQHRGLDSSVLSLDSANSRDSVWFVPGLVYLQHDNGSPRGVVKALLAVL